MTQLFQDNQDRNCRLLELSSPIENILKEALLDEKLNDHLETEKVPEKLRKTKQLLSHLMEPKCPILVAGE